MTGSFSLFLFSFSLSGEARAKTKIAINKARSISMYPTVGRKNDNNRAAVTTANGSASFWINEMMVSRAQKQQNNTVTFRRLSEKKSKMPRENMAIKTSTESIVTIAFFLDEVLIFRSLFIL